MTNKQQTNQQSTDRPLVKTVRCFDDKSLSRHFHEVEDAAAYANELLRDGHRVRMYDYRPPKRYIDYVAERGRDG